ncbi:AAA family ATPase [Dyella sp. BiH032]|uniref:AAA family ATPase n=1 Tax=Dyella sp. BiH032 TaxID=3075430 RepID=UPI00289353A0|nr:AAA family ATPase [Dyella sp. BiH032]WNL47555.1 AAA family ATPase [Dyella sp. BiH032]
MTFRFSIPTNDAPSEIIIDPGTSATFVGANGSGKTRLALFIENAAREQVHRISAHRALGLDPAVPKINEGNALRGLRYGYADERANIEYRHNHRWANGKAAVALLNDFDFLVQALFAEQSKTALVTHTKARSGAEHAAQATKFERLKNIWEHLLPHRELVISDDNIEVRVPGSGELYSASEMSDGERAIFYLIGQVLVAADNSLLVIDEPELHIHRSIMNRLWDELENARPDCALAFITHDLEFAASRVGQKFVIRDYSQAGPKWIIEAVPDGTGFSEELSVLLLGSRRPILFVEGDLNSLDKAIYRSAYPEWTVVPRGSCKDVIHSVVTMRANAAFTRIHCAGVIDADDYDTDDAAYLRGLGIAVLPVSEAENLLLLPEVSREIAIAEHVATDHIQEHIDGLKSKLLDFASQDGAVESAVIRHSLRRIDHALKKTDLSGKTTINEMEAAYAAQTSGLNIQAIAARRREKIHAAIAEKDLLTLLSIFDNKGMLAVAASHLRNTKRGPFETWLSRILLNDRAPGLIAALRRALPQVPND